MNSVLPKIPSLLFDNPTELDALHFDTLDQNGVAFHVVVAKTGYRIVASEDGAPGADALLAPLDDAAALALEDRDYDDELGQGVRSESDLAPYKPLCDVLVLGAAHAPGGHAMRRFEAALRVKAPDAAAPLPPRPQPLNPMQQLSPQVYQDWQARLEQARRSRVAGALLVDKTLRFTGVRSLQRRRGLPRLLQRLGALATLGLVRAAPYSLTEPAPTLATALRWEYAQGGECRNAAQGKHDSSQANPDGCGFARPWSLDAARAMALPAPRIEYPDAPFSAGRFWRAVKGEPVLAPANFGVVGRAWLPRRRLIGSVAERSDWGPDEVPLLPSDFDFRYWNGAPEDQQCRHLEGGERFTLVNLAPPGQAGLARDAHGNGVLSFVLPEQCLALTAADRAGAVALMPLAIDTVLIDLDAGVVELSWRICLRADATFAGVRLLHASTPEQMARLRDWQDDAGAGLPPQRARA